MSADRRTGLRIERLPDEPLGRTKAGRFFIPLRIFMDDEPATGHLIMSGSDAEELVRDLSRLVCGDGSPLDAIEGTA
ncbi:hypothetical protein [Streptomyces morookaense]|uniref:Uncharacterized protein n=1 Tax=Streptomyces morookaense TaxID=1970 RepID=A0A7Y7E566_STRMO|nr:hypothetical protein [Streptomyces morookaense]NVK76395.1 hypothetical protein [Streptomyces morookaense]GHF06727.1 hypothetical protein GCM10010359_04750 [Streptomyces morookaense]